MTKTHRLKSDPYRPILPIEPRVAESSEPPAQVLRPREGFHFVHDDSFHQRLARVLERSWFVPLSHRSDQCAAHHRDMGSEAPGLDE